MAKKNIIASQLDRAIEYIDDLGLPSLLAAIEADHVDLRKFIATLKNERKAPATRKAAYRQFAQLLKSHASSEEKAVYAKCLRVSSLKFPAQEGYVEHALASRLMKEIDGMRVTNTEWQAKVKVLAELVEHHIEEEERDFLPAIRSHLESERRIEMREEFVNLRIRSQRQHSDENGGVLSANV